ncbi:hypothetical protein BDW60DRAFT_210313 [Aspergillus nidulans var. acristatus]
MGENRLASLGKNSLLTTDLDDDKRLQLQCIAFKGIAYFGLMIGLVSSKSLAQGIATHVFAAFHDSITTDQHNGAYFDDSKPVPAEKIYPWGRDPDDAESLWKLSERIVGQKFEY